MLYVVLAAVILFVVFRVVKSISAKKAADRSAYYAMRDEELRRASEARRQLEEKRAQQEALASFTAWRESNPLAKKYTVAANGDLSVSAVKLSQFFAKNVKSFVAFDLETTGLDASTDRIVEIGAVRVVNDEVVDRFQQLVNPGIHIPSEATKINGITDKMVADCPPIERVIPSFLEFMGNDILAAHNAPFDIKFLGNACVRYDYRIPNAYFDTMELARYWPSAPNRRLITLAQFAGIADRQEHRALGDAEMVAALICEARKLRNA